MDKIGTFLQKKVLGVKVLYLVAVFVVLLAFWAWRMKPSADATGDASTDAGTDTATGEEPSQPTFSAVPNAGGSVTVGGQEDTNDTWGRRAIEWLVSQGVSVDKATIAIQKYLNGDALSVEESAIKDKAIGQFGFPPEIPQAGGTQTDPVTPPAEPGGNNGGGSSTQQHIPPGFYTIKAGDTWTKIAVLWYGSSADKWIDLLQGWNKYGKNKNTPMPHSGPLPTGERVWVPEKKEPVYATAKKGLQSETDFIKKYPPLHHKMLQEFNDGMHFPVKIGTKVRVA